MDNQSLQDLTPAVFEIIQSASKAILSVYNQVNGFRVQHKEDYSPITEADEKANDIILEGLSRLTPSIPILSEESVSAAWEERKNWDFVWIIDPLDGTKEFVKRNPEFAIQIGLIYQNQPIQGFVHAPALNESYSGIVGTGGFRWVDGKPQRLMDLVPPTSQEMLRISVSRSHLNIKTSRFIEQFTGRQLFPLGSGLKMCRIAAGETDIYPRFGPISEWDSAGPHAILKAVGGSIVRVLDREELQYNKKSLLNPDFIASRPGVIWD